jgi:Carboxypeptidase regulatory-like domain
VRVILASVVLMLFLCPGIILAQSPNGSIRGIVLDPDAKSIPGAEIIVVNDATNLQYQTKTNGEGIYAVENLPPGLYRIQVSKFGFKAIIKPNIILNVQDALAINFTLPIGASSVVVTVEGGTPFINTTDGSVSTVVDRNFVENMPLNGRSFQDLILLTPGIVTTSPQVHSYLGDNGEFSVNGQRTESNNYSVDGVSANLGVQPGSVTSSGAVPSATALGTTQGLVSVDALEEFRVQSSSYSAEYGRTPGGQFDFLTRSGSNQWHGTAFNYLRNNAFDANDWFNDYYGQPEPPLRQNDFGGTLGGPVKIPAVYDGTNKLFFFVSYEGLRLLQPQASTVTYVPDAALRLAAPVALQPVLNAFPIQNGPDLGSGLAEFIGTWSNPSNINVGSIRLDYAVNGNHRIFFRFSDTESAAQTRLSGSAANTSSVSFRTRTYTFGAMGLFFGRFGNEFRLNYSSNDGSGLYALDAFGGAVPVDLAKLQGIDTTVDPTYTIDFGLSTSGNSASASQQAFSTTQKQWNVVDTVNVPKGRHQLKFGVDYRRLAPVARPNSPFVYYSYLSEASIQANIVDFGYGLNQAPNFPVYKNFSAFAQDVWHVTSRLALSGGLRWEVNPAPSAPPGNLPYTVEGDSLGTLVLAPEGTPLWSTSWHNFAPRLGVAYILRDSQGSETVLRGGGGIFYDTAQQTGSAGYQGPGFSSFNFIGTTFGNPVSFPTPLSQVVTPIPNPPVAPYGTIWAFAPNLQLPYTWQMNVSLEQSLGKSQTISVSYVGAFGRKLLQWDQVNVGVVNPNFSTVIYTVNGQGSNYNSLQVKFQRRLSQGLQVLASYTLAHSIDYGSQNSALPYARGNSDYDVRHNFSSAVSYDVPWQPKNTLAHAVLSHWGFDDRFTARTAFPVTLLGDLEENSATGQNYYGGLNIVAGQAIYLNGPQFPGGRAINVNAFSSPVSGQVGDAPRNFVRGFGAVQMDLAARREFPIRERLKLQFRAEAFNIFNHPNFGAIDSVFFPGSITFGRATATLAQSLGILSPLYQMGGPRSMQLALKLIF